MDCILDPRQQSLLQAFRQRDTLMAFDYDGTLAPIVDDPAAAEMRPTTRHLLCRLATRYPTAVISGRRRSDALKFLQGVPLTGIVGNHGLETFNTQADHVVRQVADWKRAIESGVAALEGVVVEDKTYSLSVHYRRSPDAAASAVIRAAAQGLQGARLIGGKCVVNIVPETMANKATALMRLRDSRGAARCVYVGDDDTDEDIFVLDDPERILGIRVEASDESAARYYIKAQSDIEALLETLMAENPAAR